MTQEEKIEEAKKLYKDANADQRYVLEKLFPELKESEDEKIRKSIYNYINITLDDSDVEKEKWLSWLEKQGKKVEPVESFNSEFEKQISWLIASAINKEYEYTEAFIKWTSNAILNYAKHEIEQDEQKSLRQKQKETPISSCLPWMK